MKILIATAVYYPMTNGVAVFSHNLAVGLVRRGHEVAVICPSQTKKSYTRTIDGVKTYFLKSVDVKIYPDQIHDVPQVKKKWGLKLPKLVYKHGFKVSVFPYNNVKRILREFGPDVVHIQVSDPIGLSVAACAKKMGIPIVTTEHNQPEVITDPIKLPGFVKRPANIMLSAYFRNRQSKSDFVTMPTEQSIRNLLEKHPIDVPVAAVSNGVDLTNFKPGEASDEIYAKYKIPKDVPIVLYVGRVDPEKKVGMVIEAFNKVLHDVPDAVMLVTGDGVDKARLEKEVAKIEPSNKVMFLGRVLPPDLYEIYKVGGVFATASEIETQGIVLIEAAATGLPLIAVNKGAVAEVCLNGENGYLCESGSVDEMAEAMRKILSDDKLREKFSKKSLEIAAEHDFERTLDRFENIYNHVTSKASSAKLLD